MTIKEVEMELGIPRATIRFYEKQGLIQPKRSDNTYRDYSSEDVAVLKKVIIFRKLGLSMNEIEDLLDGTVSLTDSIEKNIIELQAQINELNGALELCRQIQKRGEVMTTFDEQFYWEELHREEKAGHRFLDITGDLLRYEKEDVTRVLTPTDGDGNPRHSRKLTLLKTALLVIACGAIVFLLEGYQAASILKGVFAVILFLLILTVFEIPSFFLKTSHPIAAKWLLRTGYVTATVGIFVYIIRFFIPVTRYLIHNTGEGIPMGIIVFGFALTVWGYVYHILELRLIFDRRHVTGINGFLVVITGGLLSGSLLFSRSKEACISYALLLIIIYQLIDHFVERKEYPEEERFKKPGAPHDIT